MQIPGGGDYLEELAMAISARRHDLLYHGKIGRQQSVYLLAEDAPDSMDASRLMVCLTLSPPSVKREEYIGLHCLLQ